MIINVHAGHNPAGMVACGAVGILNESVEDRAVKDRVIPMLRSLGHTVYDCTCDNGTSQADVLNKIVAKCNAHKVDLDVSIHFNAGGGTGTEVWVYPNGGADAYAQNICNAISSLGFRNRGVKSTKDLFVLSKTKAPALLVECCFVDSINDANIYNPDNMAQAIVKGITGATPQPQPTPQPTPTPTTHYDVWYAVQTKNHEYEEVKNVEDFAGKSGDPIRNVKVKISSGTVKYRVHVLGGDWLGWVDGYDFGDFDNGYAGISKEIDAIQIKTLSDVNANIMYRVSPVNEDYYSWVTEDNDFAGRFGKKIDRLQIKFDR